jgi:hypothetical protein
MNHHKIVFLSIKLAQLKYYVLKNCNSSIDHTLCESHCVESLSMKEKSIFDLLKKSWKFLKTLINFIIKKLMKHSSDSWKVIKIPQFQTKQWTSENIKLLLQI